MPLSRVAPDALLELLERLPLRGALGEEQPMDVLEGVAPRPAVGSSDPGPQGRNSMATSTSLVGRSAPRPPDPNSRAYAISLSSARTRRNPSSMSASRHCSVP